MKYLLKEDVNGVTHGRVIANADGVFVKGYKFDFPYKLIDLGLPSGTLWADRNIGAKSPTDAGLYFQWGDTQGWRADQVGSEKAFSWRDYKFGTEYNPTKYNSTDGKTVLDPEDDAATVNMGAKWSMPTKEQYFELFKETIPQLALSDGTVIADMDTVNSDPENGAIVWGRKKSKSTMGSINLKFTSKKDPTKELFFPISGILFNGISQNEDAGFSWLASGGVSTAYDLCFDAEGAGSNLIYSTLHRCIGLPIRGVC